MSSKMIKQYRKKPVVISAVQWTGDNQEEVFELERNKVSNVICEIDILYEPNRKPSLIINTLEGEMSANIGDWIIKGVQGELYPCKPDIFEATYEEVG